MRKFFKGRVFGTILALTCLIAGGAAVGFLMTSRTSGEPAATVKEKVAETVTITKEKLQDALAKLSAGSSTPTPAPTTQCVRIPVTDLSPSALKALGLPHPAPVDISAFSE